MSNNQLPTSYQEFIHLSRYSRWLPEEGRREVWGETVGRYFDFFTDHLKEMCEYDLPNKIKFVGYIDVLMYDTVRERYKIIDIKTSTMGWNKWAKADKTKTDQLLLYKQFYGKQNDIPLDKIDVEYFIVKRKLYDKVDWPQRRVQTFTPANGTPSINKVTNNIQSFIDECFVDGKYNQEHIYRKEASKKNCRFCEFNQTEYCDAGVK